MDIDKTLALDAPIERVWALLLDPQAMGTCVPGMKSVEVVADDEYVALMQVKISFITANFKLRTLVVEKRPPHYLKSQGTGEDTAVASSLKQTSEVFLATLPNGHTELRIRVQADVLGRLGTFGLAVMKTKADRLWDEFGKNLSARLAQGSVSSGAAHDTAPETVQATAASAVSAMSSTSAGAPMPPAKSLPTVSSAKPPQLSGWARLGQIFGLSRHHIRVEVRRGDTTVIVDWPVDRADECAAWLKTCLPG